MRLIAIYSAIAAATFGVSQIEKNRDSIVAGRTHNGVEITCDLPGDQHIRNIGSRIDGAGMCVNSSLEMAARWQGMEEWRGFRDYWAERERGGSYPSKVDSQVKRYAQEKGLPPPRYIQYEGPNPEPIMEMADKTGRMLCITYGYGPRYRGTIAHMTCCPHYRGKYAVNLDNNYPGENAYEWMSKEELVRRMKHPGKTAWVFVWLAPPPPPMPRNR